MPTPGADAAFAEAVTLTVAAGVGGSVDMSFPGGGPMGSVGPGSQQGFTLSALSAPVLGAVPAPGYAFAGWALSDGLACASGTTASPSCALAPGSLSAGATATAMFDAIDWMGPGLVSASADGATLTALPYAPGAFDEWRGAPCDGAQDLVCAISSASDELPVAVFHPFTVGIKALVFGLGYQGDAPDHFKVSFQDAPGSGFSSVSGLESLALGAVPARLSVPAHLHPWSQGSYIIEACDTDEASCVTASNGMRTLERTDSVAATGYFKAPRSAGAGDAFGGALALSADGAVLAVGATHEDSASTGTFTPGDAAYQAVLDDDGSSGSGAAYVYRRSTDGHWAFEAFVKAPATGFGDGFGGALALSATGSVLAVGAAHEDSASTGTFAPGDAAYQAALDDAAAIDGGAAYVYRRSTDDGWALEAFVKAPATGFGDGFGGAIALSYTGSVLAVGAEREDSASTGTFAPGDAAYQAALGNGDAIDSGAAYVYRRSTDDGWALEAFVKAPATGFGDGFGGVLALSYTGSVLAVGAEREDSASTGTFAPGDAAYQAALGNGDAIDSGAAYAYRRSEGADPRWSFEAFVKAPVAGAGDGFGSALALSADSSLLAVGAFQEDSAFSGMFAPGDLSYQSALDNGGAIDSGAAYAYRRSEGANPRWNLEAFVKAPFSDVGDGFGSALALSSDGSLLAVGAFQEDSASAGTFAPGDVAYQAARGNGDAIDSGAAYAYRRSEGADPTWSLEAFVKAPVAGDGDGFGGALALSADGDTLAAGALNEDGRAQPQPLSGFHEEVSVDVESNSGAVYLY